MANERVRQEALEWNRGQSRWYELLGRVQAQSVLENARPGALLDLACGDGAITAHLERHFSRVMGVDASSTHIEKAKQCCKHAEFHVSLIEDFETIECFDTVILLNILEHVRNPVEILHRAKGWLAPHGRVIAQVPNALALNRRIGWIMAELDDLYRLSKWDLEVAGHRRYYDLARLVADFENASFQIMGTGGVFLKMLSTPQMEWLLENGHWGTGEFGWGDVHRFVMACYDIGKERPEDCNIVYAIGEI